MYDRCDMVNCDIGACNLGLGSANSQLNERTIKKRIENEKQQNILSGATIRKVKQLINKFNNFHNSETKKFNKFERHKYKLLYDYEKHELKPRFETICDMFPYLAKIEQMGFTLFYYIDDNNPENNDFLYSLEYGQLRGDRVPETFKYDRLEYKRIKDHQQIFKFANEREAKMYENIRAKSKKGLDRWAKGGEDEPPNEKAPQIDPHAGIGAKKEKEYKFHLNGFNFTADDLGHNLILQYMADRRQQQPNIEVY